MFTDINIWAVLASAVASMVIGSIWYGPLFGRVFMTAVGMDQWSDEKKERMKKAMALTYLGQFAASLVMFFVLAGILGAMDMRSVTGGLAGSFLVWLGIVVPVKFGDQLWGGKMILFWLGTGNMLVTLLAAGAIIGAWR
jgi:hypothetical protein